MYVNFLMILIQPFTPDGHIYTKKWHVFKYLGKHKKNWRGRLDPVGIDGREIT